MRPTSRNGSSTVVGQQLQHQRSDETFQCSCSVSQSREVVCGSRLTMFAELEGPTRVTCPPAVRRTVMYSGWPCSTHRRGWVKCVRCPSVDSGICRPPTGWQRGYLRPVRQGLQRHSVLHCGYAQCGSDCMQWGGMGKGARRGMGVWSASWQAS